MRKVADYIKRKITAFGKRCWKWKYYILSVFMLLFIWWYNCLPEDLFDAPTCTVIRDKNGQVLNARIADDGQWRFPYNSEVPEKFKVAILEFEDERFYHHWGISLSALGRATIQNIRNGEVVSGGSTITMQLMRIARKSGSRSIYQKMVEMIWASRIEWRLSKDEILALYASNVPMGGNVVGLDAAAWRYFGRNPEDLSWAEAATLAVLPNAPGLMHPGRNREALRAKRDRLLDRLFDKGAISETELLLAKEEVLPVAPQDLPQLANHLTDNLIRKGSKGKNVVTSLDAKLQKQIGDMLNLHLIRLEKDEIHNAAVIVVDVKSNSTMAYVGNIPNTASEHGKYVDVIPAPRSSGSILKPFLYAFMLEDGLLTPEMLVEDVPTNLSGYHPTNFHDKYDGVVTASNALARSLNVPAVRMLREYGINRFYHKLKQFGLTTLQNDPDHYGLSLILGGAEVRLNDLAHMYAQMAQVLNEYPNQPSYIKERPSLVLHGDLNRSKQQYPIDPAAAWFTLKAMVEVNRPDIESYWNYFSSSRKVAWKTGTSYGFRDAWAVGVTPDYVVGVWVGNADGEGRPGILGLEAAAPIMFEAFDKLPKTGWFNPPYDEMSKIPICRMSGQRATEYCEVVDTSFVPNASLQVINCPYHQKVFLTKDGKYLVNKSCYDGDVKEDNRFVLPPVVEAHYKNKHPGYKGLPPNHPDCMEENSEQVMAFIYPKATSKIFVPRDVDGEKSKTVFEVAHRDAQAVLYWHLDEVYMGETKSFHQLEFNPSKGWHKITVVDQNGLMIERKFEVLSKE